MFSKNIKTGALIEKIKNNILYVKTFWKNEYVSDMKKNYDLENKIETNTYFLLKLKKMHFILVSKPIQILNQ